MSARKLFLFLTLSLAALMTFTLASCGGGGSGSSSSGDGTLSLELTDSATRDYRAIYVTIDRVEVINDNEKWEVATPQATYNLLELVNGVTVVLGEEKLPAGNYDQLRLIIGNDPDDGENIAGDTHEHANYLLIGDELDVEPFKKIPSGQQTGIKIVGGFTINENQTTELLLDFDAMRSVVKLGGNNPATTARYLLKPTIKVLKVAEHTSVEGSVSATDDADIAGAFVSAQTGDPLEIQAGTITQTVDITDNNDEIIGQEERYKLFLEPGDYTLVATADGYEPACHPLSLVSDDQERIDFNLTTAAITFDLSGTVTVAEPGENGRVTLKFYQTVTCNDETTAAVVVRKLNFDADAGGIDYQLSLPAGNYNVAANYIVTEDEEEIVESSLNFSLNLNTDTVENFNF